MGAAPAPTRERARSVLVIALLVAVGYLLFFDTTFLVPDSSGTYAWARSILFDGDVDFSDEFARLGSISGDDRVRFSRPGETGLPGNPFGMGSGILWMPFVALAEAGLRLTGSAAQPSGYAAAHLLAASTGTVIYGLAALLLAFGVARRYWPESAALAATIACGLGTPFFAYLFHFPTYAHVNAAFGAALALAASIRARDGGEHWRWLLAGAAVGLAALIRAQHVALLVVPIALWLPTARGAGDRRRAAAGGLAIPVGFLAVFSVQLLAWHRIYGAPWRVPQGGGFLDLLHPHLLSVLFSSWHGLFPWAPVLLLVIPGLVFLGRRDRPLLVGIAIALTLETWVIASAADWWAGYAIGARRFVDLTPLFVLGVAGSFAWLRERSGRLLPAAIAGVAVVENLLLTVQVRTGLLSPFREIGFGEMLAGHLGALSRLPGYLWRQATASRFGIHLVVHRDSPVEPAFDPAPEWVMALVVLCCWGLGLAAIAVAFRIGARRRERAAGEWGQI